MFSVVVPGDRSARGCNGPQILADQLTLSQPRGEDYANQIILASSDIQTFLCMTLVLCFS